MKTLLSRILPIVALTMMLAANAHADAIAVGVGLADHAGNIVLDIQVDPNADPVFVSDQLKANLEMSSGSVKTVTVDNGIAHVSVEGATPGAEVQALLNNDVALATGVGPSPAGTEYRRRAFWLLGGLGGLAALGGDNGNPPQAPLAEEPPPVPTSAPPAVLPTPTPPGVLSPGP